MIIKKTYGAILVLLISIACFSFQCNKGINCTENIYSFNLGVKAYPEKDSVNVGDTVWLEINESTTLQDLQTGTNVDYSDAENLGSFISYSELTDPPLVWANAASKFDFHLIHGFDVTRANKDLGREYTFIEKGGKFIFKLGVIPKEKGTFRLFFSNAANVYRRNNKCLKASFGISFKNTDQHYYLSPTYQGGNLVGGDYYFKVY